MIRVRITPEFIVRCLQTGAEYLPTRVKEGLPEGCELTHAQTIQYCGHYELHLYFREDGEFTEFDPTQAKDLNIQFQTLSEHKVGTLGNAALQMAAYLKGQGVEIDVDTLLEAANICEEKV